MKTFIWITIAVVVTLVLVWGVHAWRQLNTAAAQDKGAAVRIDEVSRGDLVEIVQAPGEVQPHTQVQISAKTMARITEIPVVEGQQVKTGDVLVRLDDQDLKALLRSTQARYAAQQAQILMEESHVAAQEAQIVGNKASLNQAEVELQREQGLLASHIVAQSVVDEAQRSVDELRAQLEAANHNLKAQRTNLEVLRHQLEAAEADISRAKQDLSYTVITSPLDGIVTVINAKTGELVVTGTMNNAGTVIMEVADLARMLVVARVDEGDVATVKVGQPSRAKVQAYPDRVFDGTVTSVALVRIGQSDRMQINNGPSSGRAFKTEILLKTDGERIYSGLTADVEIEVKHHRDVLKVPSQAVLARRVDDLPTALRDSGIDVDKAKTYTTVVYRVVDGKAVVTPVTVGPSDLTHTYIRSGLKEHERIITGPFKVLETLADAQRVHDERDDATTKPSTQGATRPTTVAATRPTTATGN